MDLVALHVADLGLGKLAAQAAPLAAGNNFHRGGGTDADLHLDILDGHAREIGEGENLRLGGEYGDGGDDGRRCSRAAIGADDAKEGQGAGAEQDCATDGDEDESAKHGEDDYDRVLTFFHDYTSIRLRMGLGSYTRGGREAHPSEVWSGGRRWREGKSSCERGRLSTDYLTD